MLKQLSAAAGRVVITEPDYDRLTHLVQSPRYWRTHSSTLQSLKEELVRGKVVPPTDVPRNVVTMQSRVVVEHPDDDETETYTLVYPDEADLDAGKLSVLSPMGSALLGARAGDIVAFDVPRGRRSLKVVEVSYQPEAAGDLHL